jgi:hypothetical protein
LIAKGRQKDQLRPWLVEAADISVYDESGYPPTILELLSVATVCIHFYSFAALESAWANVFGITIDRPSPAVDFGVPPPPHHRLWRQNSLGSAFNSRGVNQWMTIPQVMRNLPTMSVSELRFDEEQRAHYLERYLGVHQGNASERVLQHVLERING